jgi:flavorubredoxin
VSTVTEIAPDIFRICTYVPPANLQFCQFLVRDEEPLLYHTGLPALLADVRAAAETVLDPASLRWIAFSHYEADECGALNQWLAGAPAAQAACSANGALVSVNSVAERPARGLQDGEIIETGTHRFRFLATPHLPHGWDAGHLYDETTGTLLCSDLLHQNGDVEPVTSADVVARMRAMFEAYRGTPLDFYMPWTAQTEGLIERLAGLEPVVCAPMHGSAYAGDGGAALREMAVMMREVVGTVA